MNKAFKGLYKEKKVLVTGHTGFKGSWLAIWLKELGADVIGYSLAPPSVPSNFEAAKLQVRMTHVHGDIRDLDRLIETFKKYQPEFVFHLAAQPWQHVLEPLSGYLWLGALLSQDPKKYSGAWNFGPDDGSHLTVAEMVKKLIQYWGNGSWEDLSDPKALHEAKLLKLCCDKAHDALNWYSVLTIDECLRMTAEWYKEFYSETQTKDMHQFCVEQIRKYEGSAATKNVMYAQSE